MHAWKCSTVPLHSAQKDRICESSLSTKMFPAFELKIVGVPPALEGWTLFLNLRLKLINVVCWWLVWRYHGICWWLVCKRQAYTNTLNALVLLDHKLARVADILPSSLEPSVFKGIIQNKLQLFTNHHTGVEINTHWSGEWGLDFEVLLR